MLTALNRTLCQFPGVGWLAAPSPRTSCPHWSSAVEVKTIRLSGLPSATSVPSMLIVFPSGSMNSRPILRTTPGSMVHLAPNAMVTLPASA